MSADRDLLFGLLALQLDFIKRDQLVRAMEIWKLDKTKSLEQILADQGALPAQRARLIDGLVDEHLQAHDGEPTKSLEALFVPDDVQQTLVSSLDSHERETLSALSTKYNFAATADFRALPSQAERYEILRPHAKGGIGEVSIALDKELNREVALKEILPMRAGDPASRARFLQEAEITAGLEHPGVVPIYGLGMHADGRPYYAMRFIRGDSLLQAIRRFHANGPADFKSTEGNLVLRGLLRRFVDVCNAMAYAHSRGVLHRDLKPGNVMLGKYGETLVVDWGLAKALGEVEAADAADTAGPMAPYPGASMTPTSDGVALGTLGYMSPEQAAGRLSDLGVASDIYSLGATLYHLLVGRPTIATGEAKDGPRRIREGDIKPARQMNASVPPALEAVCAKAMALRPTDRYASALELADDVEQWLAGEPVSAYPEPWTARANRLARRHRTALAAAAVLLVCAVVGLSATTWIVVKKEREIAREKQVAQENLVVAQENYGLARELSFSGFGLIESADAQFAALPGLKSERKKMLEAAARAFRKYLAEQPDDRKLQAQTAKVYRYAAHVQNQEGDTENAQKLLDEALQLQRELLGLAPEDDGTKEGLANYLRDYSQVQIKKGMLSQAKKSLQESADLAEQLRTKNPAQWKYHRTLAMTLLDLAADENSYGDFAAAAATALKSAELFGDFPPEASRPSDPIMRAAALTQAAMALRETAALTDSEIRLTQAMDLLQPLSDQVPKDVAPRDVQFFLAHSRMEMGKTRALQSSQRAGSDELFAKTIEACTELAQKYPNVPRYQQNRGQAYQLRGRLRLEINRLEEALTDLTTSVDILKKLADKAQDPTEYLGDLARAHLGLGLALGRQGKKQEAQAHMDQAVAGLKTSLTKSPERIQNKRSLAEAEAAQRSLK